MTEPKQNIYERHAQTIIVSIILATILFVSGFIFTTKTELEAMKQQMLFVSQQVVELRTDIKSLRDSYVSREEFRDHETRIRELEKRR
jgi:hypothetical protein